MNRCFDHAISTARKHPGVVKAALIMKTAGDAVVSSRRLDIPLEDFKTRVDDIQAPRSAALNARVIGGGRVVDWRGAAPTDCNLASGVLRCHSMQPVKTKANAKWRVAAVDPRVPSAVAFELGAVDA